MTLSQSQFRNILSRWTCLAMEFRGRTRRAIYYALLIGSSARSQGLDVLRLGETRLDRE